MCYPESEYEHEEKRGRIIMEIEMIILDLIQNAVERLNLQSQAIKEAEKKLSTNIEPF